MHSNSITKAIHKIKQLKQQQVQLNSKFQITCLNPRKTSNLHRREKITDKINEK
jgi:hypothetical protein